jgi:outer membrane protein OmpA-like peptidoglycan-associated protein
MSTGRSSALLVTAAVVIAAGCSPARVAQPARPASQASVTQIVLLPDPETGTTGRARVSNMFGSVDLAAPRAGTRVRADRAPGPVDSMSDADVARMFAGVLASLPPAARHFTLQFQFESDALTGESAALVPEILKTVRGLPAPEVVVVGHTDTMGDARTNLALGLKRATSVRDILVKAGLARSTIEVASNGEADLLVTTPDNTPEPRNRRVEITVR